MKNHQKTIFQKREKFLEKEATTFKRIEHDQKQYTHHRYEAIKEYGEEQKQKEKELMEMIQRKHEEY